MARRIVRRTGNERRGIATAVPFSKSKLLVEEEVGSTHEGASLLIEPNTDNNRYARYGRLIDRTDEFLVGEGAPLVIMARRLTKGSKQLKVEHDGCGVALYGI